MSNKKVQVPFLAGTAVQTSAMTRDGGAFHGGNDYSAPIGTPIYAGVNGTVIWSGYNPGGHGYAVAIKDANGNSVLLSHMGTKDNPPAMPRVGDTVQATDVVGTVGNTGQVVAKGGVLHVTVFDVAATEKINHAGKTIEGGWGTSDMGADSKHKPSVLDPSQYITNNAQLFGTPGVLPSDTSVHAIDIPQSNGSTSGRESFRSYVIQLEGNGDYSAVNRNGMLGAYQFSSGTLQQIGYKDSAGNWTGKDGVWSKEDFLQNKQAQDHAFELNYNEVTRQLKANGSWSHMGETLPGGGIVTETGLVGAGWLGAGNVGKYFESGGAQNRTDSGGANVATRLKLFAHLIDGDNAAATHTPYVSQSTSTPNPDGTQTLTGVAKGDTSDGFIKKGDTISAVVGEDGKTLSEVIVHKTASGTTVTERVFDPNGGPPSDTSTVTDKTGNVLFQMSTKDGQIIGDGYTTDGVTYARPEPGSPYNAWLDPNGRTATERGLDGATASDAHIARIEDANAIKAAAGQFRLPPAADLKPDLADDKADAILDSLGLKTTGSVPNGSLTADASKYIDSGIVSNAGDQTHLPLGSDTNSRAIGTSHTGALPTPAQSVLAGTNAAENPGVAANSNPVGSDYHFSNHPVQAITPAPEWVQSVLNSTDGMTRRVGELLIDPKYQGTFDQINRSPTLQQDIVEFVTGTGRFEGREPGKLSIAEIGLGAAAYSGTDNTVRISADRLSGLDASGRSTSIPDGAAVLGHEIQHAYNRADVSTPNTEPDPNFPSAGSPKAVWNSLLDEADGQLRQYRIAKEIYDSEKSSGKESPIGGP